MTSQDSNRHGPDDLGPDDNDPVRESRSSAEGPPGKAAGTRTLGSDPRWRITGPKLAVAAVLVIAIIVPVITPMYSRIEPKLFGFPFFYWYQLAWVFLCAGLCAIAYFCVRALDRRHDDAERRAAHRDDEGAN